MSVSIYGIDDDEVIVTGDIEECYYSFNRPCKIIFSNGLEVEYIYKDGRWYGSILHSKDDNQFNIDDLHPHTTEITILDDIQWCILDIDSIYELKEMVEEKINWDEVDENTLKDLYIKFCKTYSEEKV